MSVISSELTRILTALVNITGDWFLAIAIITLGVKLILFPLSVKQQRMQLLTDNLNKARNILTKKFGTQSEKINSELMKIAAKYKINPLFTMATLIIQAPIFFSLYVTVVNFSVPIGSILVPWVSNLHMADTLHVLPVLGGLSQSLSVILTENRNHLMVILPIVIGVVFLWKAPVA
jgi:YidC/Oxa1 family membrane protein insertase